MRLRPDLSRYWSPDRIHSHTVVFELDGKQTAMPVDCFPGGLLCKSTADNRATVKFVSAVGAASTWGLTRAERLHRWLAFQWSGLLGKHFA